MNKVEIIKKYIKDMSGYNHRKAINTFNELNSEHYIRRKKQIEKQASANPLYMTKKLGTRFGKFGASGRSGVGGVGIGMPGASGTGIPPQSASNLQRLLNTSSKPVKIEGSLSSSRAAKLNGVNTNVTKL